MENQTVERSTDIRSPTKSQHLNAHLFQSRIRKKFTTPLTKYPKVTYSPT